MTRGRAGDAIKTAIKFSDVHTSQQSKRIQHNSIQYRMTSRTPSHTVRGKNLSSPSPDPARAPPPPGTAEAEDQTQEFVITSPEADPRGAGDPETTGMSDGIPTAMACGSCRPSGLEDGVDALNGCERVTFLLRQLEPAESFPHDSVWRRWRWARRRIGSHRAWWVSWQW